MAKATKQADKPTAKRSARSATNGTSQRPTEERIRELAYQFYLERAGRPGDPLNDWLRAEREVVAG
jgi:hypothetical protein